MAVFLLFVGLNLDSTS